MGLEGLLLFIWGVEESEAKKSLSGLEGGKKSTGLGLR